jgi:hypothetical protein
MAIFTTPRAKWAAERMKAKMLTYRDSLCAHLPMLALFLDPSRDRSLLDPHGSMVDVLHSLLRTEYGMETFVGGYEEQTSEQAYINIFWLLIRKMKVTTRQDI